VPVLTIFLRQHLKLVHGDNCCPICFIRLKRALEAEDGQPIPPQDLEDLFKSAFWGDFSYLRYVSTKKPTDIPIDLISEHIRSQHVYRWRCHTCKRRKPWGATRYRSHGPCNNKAKTVVVTEADNDREHALNGIIEKGVPETLDIALDKALGGKKMDKYGLASLLFKHREQVTKFPENLDGECNLGGRFLAFSANFSSETGWVAVLKFQPDGSHGQPVVNQDMFDTGVTDVAEALVPGRKITL
jgi:hypothetical protein